MSNPWDDTEEGFIHRDEDTPPVHYCEHKGDLRATTGIIHPFCAASPTNGQVALTNLSSRVTCPKCKELLAKAPPPEDE
jgi:hypothetical protein